MSALGDWRGLPSSRLACCAHVRAYRHNEGRRRTVEALLIGDVVDQENAHGSSVVSRGDGPESLLACRVPYLQLDALSVQLYRANLEVDTDGGDERRSERVFAEAQQAAGFANT